MRTSSTVPAGMVIIKPCGAAEEGGAAEPRAAAQARAEKQAPERTSGMAGSGAALGKILLMVFLGAVKGAGGPQFGDNGAVENVGFFESGDGFAGFGFLLRVMVENCGAVLRAEVGSLVIERGGIVILKKRSEKLAIRNLRGIEFDFDGFSVSG